MGSFPDAAYARLRAAARSAAEGHTTDAELHRRQALAFYVPVGATRYIREAEAQLTSRV